MLININHPKFSSIELSSGTLMIHSMQGKPRVLQENVEHLAVAVQDELVHIVGFLGKDYAWHFSGTDDFQMERIELGQPYGGGGRLVADGQGGTHLLYFAKQPVGHGSLLRHQTFNETWSVPQTVSTNVFPEFSSFNATCHNDGYVHLVYCGNKDQNLLYRVFSLEHRVWSGAVAFSEEKCSYPQFISTQQKLYLFWQEETKKEVLKVRYKDQYWSSFIVVSTEEDHVSQVGYRVLENKWRVLWGEDGKFYEASFDLWAERRAVDRGDYDYVWMIQDLMTVPFYVQKTKLPEPEIPEVAESSQASPSKEEDIVDEGEAVALAEAAAKERAQRKRESEEAKLQAAFMEQAFRTLQEWEKVREEMERWQRSFKQPEPVDLKPLATRVERLERRLMSLQQTQEQSKRQMADNFEQVEQGLTRLRGRLREVEEFDKKKPLTLWSRVLGRR